MNVRLKHVFLVFWTACVVHSPHSSSFGVFHMCIVHRNASLTHLKSSDYTFSLINRLVVAALINCHFFGHQNKYFLVYSSVGTPVFNTHTHTQSKEFGVSLTFFPANPSFTSDLTCVYHSELERLLQWVSRSCS